MDSHANYWTELEDGIDNNGNGLIDEKVKFIVALAAIGQPYSCEQWGNNGINGLPLIIEDPGTIFGWLHNSTGAYPSYAVLNHEMKIIDKPVPYGSTDNLIQMLYETCINEGFCEGDFITDNDDDGIINQNDNCSDNYNPQQEDLDGDGIGDVCDDCLNILGDVTEDGFLNINDIILIVNILLTGGIESDEFSNCEKSNADFSSDGIINVLDIIQLADLILGNSFQYCICNPNQMNLNKISGTVNIYFNFIEDDLIINLDASHSFSGVQFTFPSKNLEVELLDNSHIRLESNSYNYNTNIIAYSIFNQPFDSKHTTFKVLNGRNINLDQIEITIGDTHGRKMSLIKSENRNIFQNDIYKFELSKIYPNPFNPSTEIYFSIPKSGHITITAFNLNGQQVEIIFDGYQEIGLHSYSWYANNHPSGVYYIKLSDGRNQHLEKVLLLK